MNDWASQIDDSLKAESSGAVDRAGNTPVLSLASQAAQLSGNESILYSRALAGRIRNAVDLTGDHWKNLCRLTVRSRPSGEFVRSALLEMLSGDRIRNSGIRALILSTLTDIGHRFLPSALEREKKARNTDSKRWMDAWIQSGLPLSEIQNFVVESVSKKRLSVMDVIGRLPYIFQCYGPDFGQEVMHWMKGFSDADQKKILKWFDTHGLELPARKESLGSKLIAIQSEASLLQMIEKFIGKRPTTTPAFSRSRNSRVSDATTGAGAAP